MIIEVTAQAQLLTRVQSNANAKDRSSVSGNGIRVPEAFNQRVPDEKTDGETTHRHIGAVSGCFTR